MQMNAPLPNHSTKCRFNT